MDPENPASNTLLPSRMDAQRSGSSVKCLMISFGEIENLMPLQEPVDKTSMFWTCQKAASRRLKAPR
jgi:hypothetical protein